MGVESPVSWEQVKFVDSGSNQIHLTDLIDGLLFIFGKKAKKLRLDKLSQLIHNSAEHPNAQFAKVEIHFCDIDTADPVTASEETDEYNVIPGSEFTVARTVNRGGTSKYYLNDGV